jgi:ribosome-associated protein
MEFELKDQPYIQLNNLLKALNLVGTGGEAKIRILEGEVVVNEEVCQVIRKKIQKGDVVLFGAMEILVV